MLHPSHDVPHRINIPATVRLMLFSPVDGSTPFSTPFSFPPSLCRPICQTTAVRSLCLTDGILRVDDGFRQLRVLLPDSCVYYYRLVIRSVGNYFLR